MLGGAPPPQHNLLTPHSGTWPHPTPPCVLEEPGGLRVWAMYQHPVCVCAASVRGFEGLSEGGNVSVVFAVRRLLEQCINVYHCVGC